MGRLRGPKHHLCRRLGEKICTFEKCPVMRRDYPPGVHGPKGQRRITEYGGQLREKQKVKYIYGIMERQFRRYYHKSMSQSGNTTEMLMQHLERRLDNVVYRLGLARSRQEARQIINHGWATVNQKRVNIPSYEVKIGDLIALKSSAHKSTRLNEVKEYNKNREPVSWLSANADTFSGKIMSLPVKDDFPANVNMTLVVEYYSR